MSSGVHHPAVAKHDNVQRSGSADSGAESSYQ